MDSIQLNYNDDSTEDASSEPLLSLESQDSYNVFGEPEILPRVGDQYQVEIPQLIPEADYLFYKKNPGDEEIVTNFPCDFLIGLPIPVMWISNKFENTGNEGLRFLGGSNDKSNKEAKNNVKGEDLKIEVEPINLGESTNLGLELVRKSKMHHKHRGQGYFLVPGLLGDSWSDLEEACFLLGLYIFGKNLVHVKRFIESKNMGDILSFYYGKFYRSDGYRRWSDCRKMRSKKSVYGPRIFTGLRLQELLSRLLSRVSEECKSTLFEISKAFGEGKMSLEEFIFSLKAIVGMESLVEAVGIGKGKRDLTGIGIDPSKSNNANSTRPEIPIGKACSSLTPIEIIKFLTGDFRLSKARSNDLFWEAVWPRLLARGWHSEQPKYQIYAAGSKHSLVFLMPGVKKFSRRRLVKGNHYFDCVSDVLNKVASDPRLLELDTEADEGKRSNEENGWTDETKLEENDLSDQQRRCYLQPRTPNRNVDVMKFTVVDTSLGDGKALKMRELRSLPVEASKQIVSGSPEVESEVDTSEVSTDESDSADTILLNQTDKNKLKSRKPISALRIFSHGKDFEISAPNRGIQDSSNVPFKDHINLCENEQPRKTMKSNLSHGRKEDNDYLAPITKRRRRLTACSRGETSHGIMGPTLEQEKQSCCSDTPESSENNLSQMGSSHKRLSSTSSSKDSFICDTNSGEDEKPQTRALIDLNLPQNPPDIETGEVCMMGSKEGQDGQKSKHPDDHDIVGPPLGIADSEKQPNVNSRRQSTRNRPPTARALEALASGYLTINRRKKSPRGNSKSRPSRRARFEMGVTENLSTGTVASKVEESVNGVCNGNDDVFIKFEVLSEEKETQVSGTQYPM